MRSDACLFIQGAAAGGQGDEGISLHAREGGKKKKEEREEGFFFLP